MGNQDRKCGKSLSYQIVGETLPTQGWCQRTLPRDVACPTCRCPDHGGPCQEHKPRPNPRFNRAFLHFVETSSLQDL